MTNAAIKSQVSQRFQQLDSLRGIAALCVFLSHYLLAFNIDAHSSWTLRFTPLGIITNGRAAVMFFFVLSGFVLALPFLNSNKPLKLLPFYLKRILRIYPAYLAAIAFALLLKTYLYQPVAMHSFSPWINEFWAWHMDSKYAIELIKTCLLIGPNFNGDLIDPVIWSLVVEMKMSLIIPFIIMLVNRCNWYLNLLFFLLVNVMIYNHTFGYLGIFYLGILLAKYRYQVIDKLNNIHFGIMLLIGLVSIYLYNISLLSFIPYGDKLHPFAFFWRDYTTAVGGCIILIISLCNTPLVSVLNAKPFVFLGRISYSFYLLHLPIIITVCSLVGSALLYGQIAILILSIVLAFFLSYLSYLFIEVPFQKLAKQLVNKFFHQ
ncbi:acyltransferase family protein [Mucilaginibacter calamicampi]|uniref:Acyltransferase family protein n=1 Tax=Mucilaginibacter calamicampi TaxID=1302352 RepID=A0ABW2YWC5_9SPHI